MPKGKLDFFHYPIKESSESRNCYGLPKKKQGGRGGRQDKSYECVDYCKDASASLSTHTTIYIYVLLSVTFQHSAAGRVLGLGFR